MVVTVKSCWDSTTFIQQLLNFLDQMSVTISQIGPDNALNPPLHPFIYAFSRSSALYKSWALIFLKTQHHLVVQFHEQ